MSQPNIRIKPGLESCAMGQFGVDWIADTNTYEHEWGVITALGATVIATLHSDRAAKNGAAVPANQNALDGISLAAGASIYGYFTRIALTSGSVLAYRLAPTIDSVIE